MTRDDALARLAVIGAQIRELSDERELLRGMLGADLFPDPLYAAWLASLASLGRSSRSFRAVRP